MPMSVPINFCSNWLFDWPISLPITCLRVDHYKLDVPSSRSTIHNGSGDKTLHHVLSVISASHFTLFSRNAHLGTE